MRARRVILTVLGALCLLLLAPSIGILVDLTANDASTGASPRQNKPRAGFEQFWYVITGERVRGSARRPTLPGAGHAHAAELWHQVLAAKNATGSAGIPKVALMFLTRGKLPFEGVWQDFLLNLNMNAPGGLTWQDFYSVHVHARPSYRFAPTSFFKGHTIEKRISVAWGSWDIMQAEINLLAEAMLDPLVQRFVTLSESCVPIFPADAVWLQMLAQPKSRINACLDWNDQKAVQKAEIYRWNAQMELPHLKHHHWRKSGQWMGLTREHALLVLNDTSVADAFRQHCWVDSENMAKGWGPRSFCVSDEHYVPTLLASLGLDHETDCTGGLTSTTWDGHTAHPRTHGKEDINPALFTWLRNARPFSHHDDELPNEDLGRPLCPETQQMLASTAQLFPWDELEAELLATHGTSSRREKVEVAAAVQQDTQAAATDALRGDASRRLLSHRDPDDDRGAGEPAGAGRLLQAEQLVLEDFETPPQRQERFDFMGLKAGEDGIVSQLLRGFHPMRNGWCALFARKFAPPAAQKLRQMAGYHVSRMAAWEAAHPELQPAPVEESGDGRHLLSQLRHDYGTYRV